MPHGPRRRRRGRARICNAHTSFVALLLCFISMLFVNMYTIPENITDNQSMFREEENKISPDFAKVKHNSRPLEMLKEYQRFHSQSILLEEYQNGGIHNRTFVIGFYACPDAAGNRLHEFFNSIILAIAHNYTISWKFFDKQVCNNLGSRNPRKWCRSATINSVETCGTLVDRASWVPSYDEWADKLELVYGRRSKLLEFYSVTDPREFKIPNNNQIWIPKERNVPATLEQQGQIKDPIATERLKELYSVGTYYLYGLLFHEIFPFRDSIKPSPDLVSGGNDEISIVLHSRHVKVWTVSSKRLSKNQHNYSRHSFVVHS